MNDIDVIEIKTGQRTQFIDITSLVDGVLAKGNVRDGIAHVFVPHTTAGLTINENADPSVVRDILAALDRLAPERGDYTHGEGNSDAHIKASLTGSSVTVPVREGKLVLGTWQGIYFCEFDGPRRRNVWLRVVG